MGHICEAMAHPRETCDHDLNREKVCAPCGKKIVLGKNKIGKFKINIKLQGLIKNNLINGGDFDISDRRFPVSICGTCKVTLLDIEKNIFQRPLPNMPNYCDIVFQKESRTFSTDKKVCQCYTCLTARQKGHKKVM